MSRNLKAEEKKAWILENCIDKKGNIDLSELDFSDVDRNVVIGGMKVKKNLFQNKQRVEGDLFQEEQEVTGKIYQDNKSHKEQ